MKGSRLALALRHLHFEDCGTLADLLAQRGITLRYVEAWREPLRDIDGVTPDLVIGLGGPVSVYEADRYPWITDELQLLERRITARKPTLGICLGAQMLARVLGARVFAGRKELGWDPLTLTAEGTASVIAPLAPESTSMLHWHGDTFDLPEGARLLASTGQVAHQVFSWERSVLAFQCHPEVRHEDFESWLVGHACEIAATSGVTVARLRADTRRLGPALAARARLVFSDWLASVGL
ncbi:MAG TPA: glutamine amidotransferase [Steroidobacteraceae bacterium]|nr:glutamine amidotransferase [Steroidobacteraceae bacterium]